MLQNVQINFFWKRIDNRQSTCRWTVYISFSWKKVRRLSLWRYIASSSKQKDLILSLIWICPSSEVCLRFWKAFFIIENKICNKELCTVAWKVWICWILINLPDWCLQKEFLGGEKGGWKKKSCVTLSELPPSTSKRDWRCYIGCDSKRNTF